MIPYHCCPVLYIWRLGSLLKRCEGIVTETSQPSNYFFEKCKKRVNSRNSKFQPLSYCTDQLTSEVKIRISEDIYVYIRSI